MPVPRFGPRPWVRRERERLAALRFERIGVRPLGATLGAEIHGVDLARLDDATFDEIARAFVEVKVIFFRDQEISTDAHLDFCRRFGELEEHPFLPSKDGYEKIVRFAKDEGTVVRTHPVTGRKSLYVNAIFTSHLVGLPREESDRLLDLLYRQADVPEYQCRFHWKKNSIALWDNRSVQHYACSDYDPQRRVMDRVTVIGDRPA